METELIVALDVDSRVAAVKIVEACGGCDWFKVGFQLFTRYGPSIVEEVRGRGKQVMLDLKFHDIPNTVRTAAKAAADLEVSLLTLHAAGGRAMIAAAREGVEGTDTKLLAVTVLTSLDEAMLREEVGFQETPDEAVARLGALAVDAGAHGLVASPREIRGLREVVGTEPLIVTPGIRPTWAGLDDQKRTTSPWDAAIAGATHIVVGRPVLNHENPSEAVKLIREELHGAGVELPGQSSA